MRDELHLLTQAATPEGMKVAGGRRRGSREDVIFLFPLSLNLSLPEQVRLRTGHSAAGEPEARCRARKFSTAS